MRGVYLPTFAYASAIAGERTVATHANHRRRMICTHGCILIRIAFVAANNDKIWGVVIADVIGSSHIPNLKQIRNSALARLSERHLDANRVLARYTITAWDEFQNVLAQPWELPRVVWDLRLAFHPAELRIGAGFGTVRDLPGPETAVNEESSGEAFVRARDAVSLLGKERRKYGLHTVIRCGDPELERTLDLVYMLADTLLFGLSNRQWETIQVYDRTGSQDDAAKQLHVKSESTVSRNLRRGHYWQLLDARKDLEELLRTRFAS